jgi:indolepyruvate ferredoxin oxidoreductase
MERRLIREYRAALLAMLDTLHKDNFDIALELADLPQMVKGFGHIKEANVKAYRGRLAELQARLQGPVMKTHTIYFEAHA